MEPLHPDWRALLELSIERRVKFLIIGAHALAAHGRPRLTGDLDLFVKMSEQNAARIADALREFGLVASFERTRS
jgi:hypothetical protein